MGDSDSIILSFSSSKTAGKQTWLAVEVVSTVILVLEVVVFGIAFLSAHSLEGYGGYASTAYVFMALWICLALEGVAFALAALGAKRRDKVTLLLSVHGLLLAMLGLMSLPTLF